MHQHQGTPLRGYLFLIGLGTIVLAFMALSLAITATGTARFAIAMGYGAEVGYAVGGIFDLAKALLPIALLVFFARRAFFFFALIGCAWLGLVTYSWLATHATVSAAIATIERNGTWKMESRTNAKSELGGLEQRLAALSRPLPPRPSKSVAEALGSERVPVGVWKDSDECASIRGSRYFERTCAKVLELRRELAAAQDYEKIEARVGELRHALAIAPIVAIQDPMPRAFTATIGRLVPFDGDVGVAHLLTLVVELMSCFGLGAVRLLSADQVREGRPDRDDTQQSATTLRSPDTLPGISPGEPVPIIPQSSPEARERWRSFSPKGAERPTLQCGRFTDATLPGVGQEQGKARTSAYVRAVPLGRASARARIRPSAAEADCWSVAWRLGIENGIYGLV